MKEPLQNLFTGSKLVVLNFKNLSNVKDDENLKPLFDTATKRGEEPTSAENRQKFNEILIDRLNYRYLVGAYGEDRFSMLSDSAIASEHRFLHLGVDIFSKNQEEVFSPCDGEIVVTGREDEEHSFGNYLIIKPDDKSVPYILLAHLVSTRGIEGRVKAGQKISKLGSYVDNENGGWSRHLHIQMMTELPNNPALLGYSSKEDFAENQKLYPDPMDFFPEWRIN